MEHFEIKIENKDNKAKLVNDGYDTNLFTMQNGFQWTGMPVNDELISMIEEVIADYKSMKEADADS